MSNNPDSGAWQHKRQRAAKTALLLGLIAVLIFAAFIAAAIIGH